MMYIIPETTIICAVRHNSTLLIISLYDIYLGTHEQFLLITT